MVSNKLALNWLIISIFTHFLNFTWLFFLTPAIRNIILEYPLFITVVWLTEVVERHDVVVYARAWFVAQQVHHWRANICFLLLLHSATLQPHQRLGMVALLALWTRQIRKMTHHLLLIWSTVNLLLTVHFLLFRMNLGWRLNLLLHNFIVQIQFNLVVWKVLAVLIE